jgi:tRNA (adenine57-N1/adenine58-N1)-methyltransferase
MDRFAEGDLVLLVDSRERRYMFRLVSGGVFHSHAGTLTHAEVLGKPQGTEVASSGGARYLALRPTLAEYTLKMKRGPQVIYPKDTAAILIWGDIFPGAAVVEAGIGSGALTLALLRAVGPRGRVTSYEVREDHAAVALANIESFAGAASNHTLRIQDVADGIDAGTDRVVLDLPDPWRVVPAVSAGLVPGGILVTYVPTVPQVQQTVIALEQHGFGFVQTFEVLHRGWHVTARSVRPDHRMVAHTGFITVARSTPD